jgi:N-acetylneuraminic acid mutarotase
MMKIAVLGTALALSAVDAQVIELPSLPHAIAGQFVGTVSGTLVVAGGSRWTAPPSQGGTKVFDDGILALGPDETHWQQVARLPKPLAYGGAASLKRTLLFAGGQGEAVVSRSVWALGKHGSSFQLTLWPDLPASVANFSMAMAGGRIYVYGGQESKDSLAGAQLWSLSIDAEERPGSNWQHETSMPGPGRILAAAAGCQDTLYILGGATLSRATDGSLIRHYSREAWSYSPMSGWKRLPDLPAASVAAPAECDEDGNVLLLGGDDGSMAGVALSPGELHPGFSRTVERYSPSDNAWASAGQLPLGLVTTGSAVWKDGRIVVPGGEDRPGSRSNKVLELRFDR